MARHIEIGKIGEKAAQTFLKEKGYEIRATNWRYQRAEIDIIAVHNGILVFIEVKTRTSDFSLPEAAVNTKKQKLISKAASAYMYHINHTEEFRFDVLSIYIFSENDIRIEHLEDAFFLGLI